MLNVGCAKKKPFHVLYYVLVVGVSTRSVLVGRVVLSILFRSCKSLTFNKLTINILNRTPAFCRIIDLRTKRNECGSRYKHRERANNVSRVEQKTRKKY